MIDFPLAPNYYLDALRVETERLSIVARRSGLSAAVVYCPGWDVAKLVLHVGVLHRWVMTMVENAMTERLDVHTIERAPEGDARIDWLEEGVSDLVATLERAGTDRVVWTLAGEGHSAFWFRRMTLETMVHRLDAETAAGIESVVDPLLAADGVDEYWSWWLGRKLAHQPITALGGVLRIRATDADAEWTVSLSPDSVDLAAPDAPIGLEVAGPALDLLKFVWNRGGPMSSEVHGDRSLIDSWSDLVKF